MMETGNGRFSMCGVADNGKRVIANVLDGKWFYFHFVLPCFDKFCIFFPSFVDSVENTHLQSVAKCVACSHIRLLRCVCVCSCAGKCWRVRMPSLRSFDWDTFLYIGKFVYVQLCAGAPPFIYGAEMALHTTRESGRCFKLTPNFWNALNTDTHNRTSSVYSPVFRCAKYNIYSSRRIYCRTRCADHVLEPNVIRGFYVFSEKNTWNIIFFYSSTFFFRIWFAIHRESAEQVNKEGERIGSRANEKER